MLDFEEEDKYNQYQLVNVSPTISPSTSTFKLPDGWTVEEVPRKMGSHTDRYYYEPGTQQKFRSLTAVQNHLAELENVDLYMIVEIVLHQGLVHPITCVPYLILKCLINYWGLKESSTRQDRKMEP